MKDDPFNDLTLMIITIVMAMFAAVMLAVL